MQGDVNGDGIADVWDLSLVAVAYGTFEGEPVYDPYTDINKDGIVDIADVARAPMSQIVMLLQFCVCSTEIECYSLQV